jgi:glycosyltransferase involved in cell wall biosynthesis
MALMSTWDMRCGIAEYSRYLAKALEEHHVDIHIIANTRSDWQSARSLLDISRNINELWIYDHQQGQNSSVNIDEILRFLKKEKISKLNIQYHPGFFSGEILLDLAAKCIQADVHVSITFHNAKEPDHEILKELVNIGVNLIVHNYEEKLQLLDAGICAVHHITQGILEEDDEDVNSARLAMQISGRPVIGSFGFLRTHKGILELIEAVGILRVTYPDIFLLALNALYPSRDSEECFLKCKLKIQELGMEDNILLITDFIDVKQIMRYLHATDVIVLPYHSSTEGTSATAAVGLAARRPLIVSKSHIFDDIRDLCYRVDEIEPAVLAQNIKKLLANSALQKTMKKRILIHAERNSWKNVAKRYIEVFS